MFSTEDDVTCSHLKKSSPFKAKIVFVSVLIKLATKVSS